MCLMSIGKEYQDRRERYEFQMGQVPGRLATALDILNDALALVGAHAVYCRNSGEPDKPKMDIQTILDQMHESKHLISEVLRELRKN